MESEGKRNSRSEVVGVAIRAEEGSSQECPKQTQKNYEQVREIRRRADLAGGQEKHPEGSHC